MGPVVPAERAELLESAEAVKGRSLWVDARRRLFRNRAAVVSMIVLATIAAMARFRVDNSTSKVKRSSSSKPNSHATP